MVNLRKKALASRNDGAQWVFCRTEIRSNSRKRQQARESARLNTPRGRLERLRTRRTTDRIREARLPIAPYKLAESGAAPQTKGASFAEVGMLAEILRRPCLRNAGRLLMPPQATANSVSEESADAHSVSPPAPPDRRGNLAEPPWRIDKLSHARALGD